MIDEFDKLEKIIDSLDDFSKEKILVIIKNQKIKYRLNPKNKILYNVWKNMIARCTKKTDKYYNHYGGRGILVDNNWLQSYELFHKDMIYGYKKGLYLDRIDNNGNYCKENCRRSTAEENVNNRRCSVTFNGKSLHGWCNYFGLNYDIVKKQKNRKKIGVEKVVKHYLNKEGLGNRISELYEQH